MANPSVKPKSKPLYDHLRDKGLKKKKAAKIANRFVVTKRGDSRSTGSGRRRPAQSSGNKKRTKSSNGRTSGRR